MKKNQNIDSLIQRIKIITKNRFSLLDDDLKLLNEVIEKLEELKQMQNQNDHSSLLLAVRIAMMLAKVFFSNDQN